MGDLLILIHLAITELVKNILHGSYAPIPDEMSDNLRQLIAKMLIKDPVERPSIKEILQSEFLAVVIISRECFKSSQNRKE